MNEGKNTSSGGKSSKKTASDKKPPVKTIQKAQPKPETAVKPRIEAGDTASLVRKIEDVGGEIEGKPLKSFEKKEREKVIQSYERLIFRMVREINNSRQ